MDATTLYIVATPIGKLDEFSPRAVAVLKSVSLVLAEDTRSFAHLARRFGIETRVTSYFGENERRKKERCIEQLEAGESLALVSEAGMPTVSDPGSSLVRACHEKQIPVRAVSGPSAVPTILALSGFSADRFVFEGFLPRKPGKLRNTLNDLLQIGRTAVFFESPYRIIKTIALLAELAPERPVFVGRELTKMYEEHWFGPALEISVALTERKALKGEFAVVIAAED